MKRPTDFLIGFEIDTGEPVRAKLHHLFISGVTQHSGKTTSLEAFLSRTDRRALIFRCGRGEIGFDGARTIRPYFRERTDWRFVEGLLSAHLQEKTKFYRSDIMKATRGAHSLGDVHDYIKAKLAKAKADSWIDKVYTELDQYFSEVIPTLGHIDFAPTLDLGDGLNMIDLEGVPVAVQQLIISSCADLIMEKMHGVILVVPEAWSMIPQDRGSPVKLAADNLIRQGGKLDNYLWLDSQQMTGVDMNILRNIDIWAFGRQSLDLEKKRVAGTIPGKKVKADDIHALEVGQFYIVQYGEKVQRVYVMPAWEGVTEDLARQRARNELPLEAILQFKPERTVKPMADKDLERAHQENERLRIEFESVKKAAKHHAEVADRLRQDLYAVHAGVPPPSHPSGGSVAESTRGKAAAARAVQVPPPAPSSSPTDRVRYDMTVQVGVPHLTLEERVIEVRATTDDREGQVALLIADGFFDSPVEPAKACREFKSRGWGEWSGGAGGTNMRKLLGRLTTMGFLREANDTWQVVPEAKPNIKRVRR